MMRLLPAVVGLALVAASAVAQYPDPSRPRPPGSAGPKPGGGVVERGTQPNAGEVRPSSPAGDTPSAAAGQLVRDEKPRRILGLRVNAALLLGGVLVVLLVVAGLVIPSARRRSQAQGGGSTGRASRP